jgi:hypothetical protein
VQSSFTLGQQQLEPAREYEENLIKQREEQMRLARLAEQRRQAELVFLHNTHKLSLSFSLLIALFWLTLSFNLEGGDCGSGS